MSRIVTTEQALAHVRKEYQGVPWELIGALHRQFADRGRVADQRREFCLFLAELGR